MFRITNYFVNKVNNLYKKRSIDYISMLLYIIIFLNYAASSNFSAEFSAFAASDFTAVSSTDTLSIFA